MITWCDKKKYLLFSNRMGKKKSNIYKESGTQSLPFDVECALMLHKNVCFSIGHKSLNMIQYIGESRVREHKLVVGMHMKHKS